MYCKLHIAEGIGQKPATYAIIDDDHVDNDDDDGDDEKHIKMI